MTEILRKFCCKGGFLVLLIFICESAIGYSEETGKKQLLVFPVDKRPIIDGKLNDPVWQKIKPVSDFVQYAPYNGAEPTEKTYAYVAYDENNLYVAFHCFDSYPERIVADITPRNEYENNDQAGILLDTYNDHRNYYWFGVNPRGIQNNTYDREIRDTIWESAARITSDGWTAEMAIPFKSLHFSKDYEQKWSINFSRTIQSRNELLFWTKIGRQDRFLDKCGLLLGLRGIKGGHNLEAFPFAVGRYSGFLNGTEKKKSFGLDLKYSPFSNITFHGSVSPDYSEVVADPFFINLTPYEYHLQENRPFFQEGAQIFRTPIQVFYSRRIQNPILALKMTGKVGSYTTGCLLARDNENSGPNTDYGVFRLQKDVLKNSQIGAILAYADQGGIKNTNVGVDGTFWLKRIWTIWGQYVRAGWNSMERERSAYQLSISRQATAGVVLGVWYTNVDPEFSMKTGYVREKDKIETILMGGYQWLWNRGVVRSLEISDVFRLGKNHINIETEKSHTFSLKSLWFNHLEAMLGYSTGRSRLQVYQESGLVWDENFLRSDYFFFTLNSSSGGLVDGAVTYYTGKSPVYLENYTKTSLGKFGDLSLLLTLKPRHNLEISTNVNYQSQSLLSTNETLFNGWTSSSTLKLQFTKNLFARTIFYTYTEGDRYRTDILLGRYFKAGSVFYLSYRELREKANARFSRTNYTLLAKFSYLWRL